MVHIVDGKPSKVPEITPKTKEEIEIYELGKRKHNEIKARYLNS